MRLSITVLCTLALALVAQGIPVPTLPTDEGNTTPSPEPEQHPTTPAQPQQHQQSAASGSGQQPRRPSSAVLGSQYTPYTGDVHRADVHWAAPSDHLPPGISHTPHPFIVTQSPSPGGTTHGLTATHSTQGGTENNRPANSYLPQQQTRRFSTNADGHPTNINIAQVHQVHRDHLFSSSDPNVPRTIPQPGFGQLQHDSAATQRSTRRPTMNFRGAATLMRGVAAFNNNRGRGRGRGGDGTQGESSTATRGRPSTRGNRGDRGGSRGSESSSRSNSRGSNRRGASQDKHGEHRTHPYSRDKAE